MLLCNKISLKLFNDKYRLNVQYTMLQAAVVGTFSASFHYLHIGKNVYMLKVKALYFAMSLTIEEYLCLSIWCKLMELKGSYIDSIFVVNMQDTSCISDMQNLKDEQITANIGYIGGLCS